MLVKAINLAIVFLTLNKAAKANAKAVLTESIDIGLALSKIAKAQKVDQKTKDSLAKEVKDFNKAVQIAMARKSQQQKDMTKIGGQDILKNAIRKAPKLGPWAAFIAGLAMSDDLVRAAGNMTPN